MPGIGFFCKPVIGGGPTIYTDNFNRADGSLGVNWGVSDGWSIVSNLASRTGGGTDFATFAQDIGSADHWAELQYPGGDEGTYRVVNARHPSATDTGTCYMVFREPGSSNVHIGKSAGGTYSDLNVVSVSAWGTGEKIAIEVSGADPCTIKGYLNGSLVITATDSDIDTGNFAGINANEGTVDNFRCGPGTYPGP